MASKVVSCSGFELTLEQERCLLSLYDDNDCTRVEAKKLHGGFSGAVVLLVEAFDGTNAVEPAVVKIDERKALEREMLKMQYISEENLLGENSPEILSYAESGKTAALSIELCGAQWSLPGFAGKQTEKLLCTFEDIYLSEMRIQEDKVDDTSSIDFGDPRSIIMEVFGSIMMSATLKNASIEKKVSLEVEYCIADLADRHVFDRKKTVQAVGKLSNAKAHQDMQESVDLDRYLRERISAQTVDFLLGESSVECCVRTMLASCKQSPCLGWKKGWTHGDL